MTGLEPVVIGTSGYSYKYWGNDGNKNIINFYDSDVSKKQLEHYCKYFKTVEINCTKYKKLTKQGVQKWYDDTPIDFTFTIKMPMYITTLKKLIGFADWWPEFYDTISLLKNKLDVLLFLFSDKFPRTKENIKRLEEVKKIIPEEIRCAFEFRHSSWYDSDNISSPLSTGDIFTGNWTMAILHTMHLGVYLSTIDCLPICEIDPDLVVKHGNLSNGYHFSDTSRSNFTYIRLHGTLDYSFGSYGYAKMKEVIDTFVDRTKTTYIYSNSTDTWEIFDYKTATIVDYCLHTPNVDYIEIKKKRQNGIPCFVQLVPAAVYDMLLCKMLISG